MRTQANRFVWLLLTAGVLALMGDGSVRLVRVGISVPAWSAAVTPNGGEAVGLDN